MKIEVAKTMHPSRTLENFISFPSRFHAWSITRTSFPAAAPQSWADFWDVNKFPAPARSSPGRLPACLSLRRCLTAAYSDLRMLTAFDQDVEITTRPHRKTGEAGRIIFNPV